jgi:hypothetical protein
MVVMEWARTNVLATLTFERNVPLDHLQNIGVL